MVVLKGVGMLVVVLYVCLWVIVVGNFGMVVGGMGDLLIGVIVVLCV